MTEVLPDSRDLRQEPDGTWTVCCRVEVPITGIPNRELAEKIADALWESYGDGIETAVYDMRD